MTTVHDLDSIFGQIPDNVLAIARNIIHVNISFGQHRVVHCTTCYQLAVILRNSTGTNRRAPGSFIGCLFVIGSIHHDRQSCC